MRQWILVLGSLIAASCAVAQPLTPNENWSFKDLDSDGFSKVEITEPILALAEKFEKKFAADPYYSGYTELILVGVYRSEQLQRTCFIFDNMHLDDLQVVFIADLAGIELERFMYAPWSSATNP